MRTHSISAAASLGVLSTWNETREELEAGLRLEETVSLFSRCIVLSWNRQVAVGDQFSTSLCIELAFLPHAFGPDSTEWAG